MPRNTRPREDSDDDDWYDQTCEEHPDMSNRAPSSRPEGSEPPCQRRRTTPFFTDEIVSVYTTENVRRMSPKKDGKKPSHRPQRHHDKAKNQSRPLDPRMYSNDLFQSRQLGSQALAALLELANLGSAYENLKHSLRGAGAHEVHRRISDWVEEMLRLEHWPLKNRYSLMAEVLVNFVRVACGANQKRAVVEALTRLVQEDDRVGSTELVS